MPEINHERFMRRAIEFAAQVPELPFGSVIVDERSGEVVATGWNKTSMNPTWHGEMVALNELFQTGELADRKLLLYTTAEPCPMCMGALLWSGIGTVVFGSSIRFLMDIGWPQLNIPAREIVERSTGLRCSVIGGVLESECNELFLTASRAAPGR
jgi:tRNA(Arg) A34 adenosine deaminase TadA